MVKVRNSPSSSAVLLRVRGIRSSLKGAEGKVADYLLKYPEDFSSSTVAEIATTSKVSEATVIRFCRTLGFSGFNDIKMQVSRELYSHTDSLIPEELKESDSAHEIIGKVFSFNIQTLEETLEVLDSKALSKAGDIIASSGKLLIVGVGTSSANVQDAHNKFFRIGINSVAQSDAHLQLMEASLLTSKDTVLAISHSGRTKDPIETLEIAKACKAKTIVITGNPASPLASLGDIILLTASSESRFRKEALSSRLAQMSIIDALHTIISIRHKKSALSATKKIEAVIGQKQIWEKR